MYPLDDDGKQQRLTHENKLKAQPTQEKEYAVSSRGPAMFRPFSLLLTFPILIAADSNPLIDQFNRLMGEPREIVGALGSSPSDPSVTGVTSSGGRVHGEVKLRR